MSMNYPSDPSSSATFRDMTLARGLVHAPEGVVQDTIRKLLIRLQTVRQEHEVFRQWCDRADRLYYADVITPNHGADLWPEHESAQINGRQHISVNLPAAYVDIPAALQAVDPIENMLATDTTQEARDAAAATERVYTAWKQAEDFDLKWHKAITVKGLYGRTAARLYWDKDEEDGKGRVCVDVVQQPRHLFLGWRTDSFEELEWAAYRMFYEPNALTEAFGVEVTPLKEDDGTYIPYVQQRSWDDTPARTWSGMGSARIEVYDYWYRVAVWKGQQFVRMDTYNVVIAGNYILRGPTVYPEYKGELPYVPLFNTFVPGLPGGRPDLYDIEPLIREKMERITSGAQMINNGTNGDAFQLVGPEAPSRVPSGLKPIKNGIVAPGPGNRIEVITPFIAAFQLEQYLGRIDREMNVVSGLNDLLLGLAPSQVLSSSKAINALIAQFEARLSLRRKLLYKWRRDIWKKALGIMAAKKVEAVNLLIAHGSGYLEILDPSLNPRDDMETMTRALNAINGKIASQRTAMNWIGIDDPETEQDLIREERTDATMFPADVQVMAQLLSALQSLGLQAPGGVQQQAQQQLGNGQNDLRQALGAQTPQGTPGSQGVGAQGEAPSIPGAPPEAQPGNTSGPAPFGQAPDNQPVIQGMIQGGQTKGRILTQQKLGRR